MLTPTVYALSTARAGSKSIPDKNLIEIRGQSLYLFNLMESLNTPEIKGTFLTTNMPKAIADGPKYGYQVIIRPDDLCQDQSTHTETIYHGLLEIEKTVGEQADILVVMLGNTMNMDRSVVTQALALLNEDPALDSVVTVIRANHFNPIRAYIDDGTGCLTTYLDQNFIREKTNDVNLADKNTAGNILFQNGLWIVRRRAIIQAQEQDKGLQPFPWFGMKVRYLEQNPRLQEVDDYYQIRLLS